MALDGEMLDEVLVDVLDDWGRRHRFLPEVGVVYSRMLPS